jgi:hypothetical protein
MRKTASYLNQLRLDVQTILYDIEDAGTHLDSKSYDLSRIVVHDLKTDDGNVKVLFDDLVTEHKRMANLIKSFRIAREKYLEFF